MIPDLRAMASAAVGSLVGMLPWPLSPLVDVEVNKLRRATAHNPVAPNLPAQERAAITQTVRDEVRSAFPGESGSEAAWDVDQGMSSIGTVPLHQDPTARPLPPSWFLPNGLDRIQSYTGPVLVPDSRQWGVQGRPAPRIIAGRLVQPGDRTPTAREMAQGFLDANPGRTRIMDVYDE